MTVVNALKIQLRSPPVIGVEIKKLKNVIKYKGFIEEYVTLHVMSKNKLDHKPLMPILCAKENNW